MDFSDSRFDRLCDAVEKVMKRGDCTGDLEYQLANPHQRNRFVEQLTAELTVGETFFFRNEHHFQALRELVIPEILRDNINRREIRLWSAGCATGEEPHSLAILLDQILYNPISNDPIPTDQNSNLDRQAWQVSILATDINTEFLQRARKAEYRNWSFRRTDIQNDARYFITSQDKYCLRPAVRESVRFVYLNLVKDVYPSSLNGTAGLDLILFRNVAIYLHAEVIAAIVQRFLRCLRPGGWLLLGEAEVSQIQPAGFNVRRIGQATFFQKPHLGAVAKLSTERLSTVLPPICNTFRPLDNSVLPSLASHPPNAEPPTLTPPTPLSKIFLEVGRIGASHGLAAGTVASAKTANSEAGTVASAKTANSEAGTVASAKTANSEAPPIVSTVIIPPPFDWEQVEGYVLHEDYDAAEGVLNRISNRHLRANMKLKFVRRLLEVSQTVRARAMLEASLNEEPLLIDGYLLKASLAEERGELAEAESACRRALYLDRTCAMAHFHLALVQQQSGDVTGARKSLQSVQKISDLQDTSALVDHGDGVCYGRLWEMAQSMLGS